MFRSKFKRNFDFIVFGAIVFILALGAALEGHGQSTTKLSRRCPGAAPSPANALVNIEADGDIAITNCSGKTTTITGTIATTSTSWALANGTAAAPSFSFLSDTDTGMFRSGGNALGFATGGAERGTLSNAGLWTTTGGISTTTGLFSGVVLGPNGTAGAPTYSFSNSPTAGFFRSAVAGEIGVSTGGVERWTFDSLGSLVVTQGTLTGASRPWLNQTATWNNGATTFTNELVNITNTASAAASKFVDYQIAGASQFSITKAGLFTGSAGVITQGTLTSNIPGISQTATWNEGATLFRGIQLNVTDTTSLAASRFIDLQLAGVTKTSIDKAGTLATGGGILSSSPTLGIGYTTGAGGAQTQATSKATTVVSNTITTAVTMNNAALNAGVAVAFTFTNSSILATDQVVCTHESAGTSTAYLCNAFPSAGSAVVTVRNVTAGNLSEAIVLRISVYRAVSN